MRPTLGTGHHSQTPSNPRPSTSIIWVVVKIMVPVGAILGLYRGYLGDNGKENGNYYNGLYAYTARVSPLKRAPTNPQPLIAERQIHWPSC